MSYVAAIHPCGCVACEHTIKFPSYLQVTTKKKLCLSRIGPNLLTLIYHQQSTVT